MTYISRNTVKGFGFGRLMAIAAQFHHLLILITQHTRQLDVGLAMEPDIIIFKQPSILHIRFARNEFKPEVQEAWERFNNLKGDKQQKSMAFVANYLNGNKRFLRTKLPTFWSEQLSEVFALYETEDPTPAKKEVKTKKVKRSKTGKK